MNITICGHAKAVKILELSPNQLDVIFISNPDDKYGVSTSEKIPLLTKEFCCLLFHDISFDRGSLTPPNQTDIEKALDFAKGRNDLIVTCQAGISRSSATAYVIQAAELGAIDALNVLDLNIHFPNDLIIEHGSKILNNPELIDAMKKWKNKAEQFQIQDQIELS